MNVRWIKTEERMPTAGNNYYCYVRERNGRTCIKVLYLTRVGDFNCRKHGFKCRFSKREVFIHKRQLFAAKTIAHSSVVETHKVTHWTEEEGLFLSQDPFF